MLNGHWQQWIDEAQQHWQSALAFASFVKAALPLHEWFKIAVVAVVTAVSTTWATTIELKSEIRAINQARDAQIVRRDREISAMHAQDEKTSERLRVIAEDVAVIKARMK